MTEGRWVVGVDGCPVGWVGVRLSDESASVHLYATVSDLWAAERGAALILIDIPIGLPSDHERAVDARARRVLGVRSSSIFSVPTRSALYAATYAEANEINGGLTGKKLSKQLWNIAPKIREVDLLLHTEPAAREKFAEIHPEVLFWGLTGRPMAHAKKARIGVRWVGINERLAIVEAIYPGARAIYERALNAIPRAQAGRDDLVDALAAAVTGWLVLRGEPLVPLVSASEYDAYGLPMQMVYVRGEAHPPRATQTQITAAVASGPRIERLHHAQITIPPGSEAEAEARAFYCDLLGLTEIPKPAALAERGGFWVTVAGQQVHFGVEADVDRRATKAHLAYLVSDLDGWRDKLSEHGVVIEEQIPVPGLARFEFRDPFGNRVEFTEPA